MKANKVTQQQRIGRLEKVVAELYLINKMIQDELKMLQDKLKND